MNLDTVLTLFSLSVHTDSSISKGSSKAKANNLRSFCRSHIPLDAHVVSQAMHTHIVTEM